MKPYTEKIMNLINMEYVMRSPENAQVCVDMLLSLVKEHPSRYKDVAMKIMEEIAGTKINIMSARDETMPESAAGHVINGIYAVLQEIVKEEPYELGNAKRVSDILERNNDDFIKKILNPTSPDHNCLIGRSAFFDTLRMHTDAEKIKQMHQQRS